MKRTRPFRYRVVHNGDEIASYTDPGPALSRTITEATRANEEGTWYVRDFDDSTLGYTERFEKTIVTTRLPSAITKGGAK